MRRLARELDAKRRWLFEAEVAAQQLRRRRRQRRGPGADPAGAGSPRRRSPTTGGCSRPATMPTPTRPRASSSGRASAPAWNGASRTSRPRSIRRNPGARFARPGGVATVDWLVTDQMRLAFAGELYSWDTPLRALLFGITADEYSAKATYRWHESRSLAASFAYLPFTRRQPAICRRHHLQGAADQPAGLRPHRARRGLCLEQQPAQCALLQSRRATCR